MTAEQYGHAYEQGFKLGVRFFVSQGAGYDDAIECVQAAWAKGWEYRHQLRDAERLLPWILKIARNLRSVRLKRLARFSTEADLVLGNEDPAIGAIEARNILEKCTPRCRAVLEAYYLQGLTVAEIATLRNASRGTVRTLLVRARRNARRDGSLKPRKIPARHHL